MFDATTISVIARTGRASAFTVFMALPIRSIVIVLAIMTSAARRSGRHDANESDKIEVVRTRLNEDPARQGEVRRNFRS